MSHGSSPTSRRVDPYWNDVSQEIPTKAMDAPSLTHRLRRVLNDVVLYRQLLRSKGTDAQALLDLFQSILDSSELDTQFRRLLIVATQRLSRTSGLYPVCYELKGVKQECEPVTAGGFADIHKGEFEGHVVCLKVIRTYQDSQIEHLLKQFSREVVLWGQLSHANVLPMYGLYRYKKRLCFVAPWMENGDIGAYLKQNPDADRYSLASDVAKGLKYLHMHGIIHGDLKGPNVLVDDAGRARLCDFGISSVSDPELVAWTSLSTMSSKGGSIRWQAPELFDIEGDESVRNSTLSDVYALGCVYYEIFTGNIPFYGTAHDFSVIVLIQRGSRPSRPLESSPAWRDWGLTEATWGLMQDCWSTQPLKRPTIDQVIHRLAQPLHQTRSRKVEIGGVLSSSRFRGRTKEPLNETTASAIDRLFYNVMPESAKQHNTVLNRLHQVSSPNAVMPLLPSSKNSSRRDIDDDMPNNNALAVTKSVENSSVPSVNTASTDGMITADARGRENVQHNANSLDYLEPDSVKPTCTNCGVTHSPVWRRSLDGDLICEACVQYFKLYIRLRPNSTHNTHDEPTQIPPDQDLTSLMEQCHICYTTETPFWRRDNQGQTVCSACGLYYKIHGLIPPHSEKSSINRKRSRHDNRPFFNTSSTSDPVLRDNSPANDSSSQGGKDGYTDMDVTNRNKRQRLSTGELHDDRDLASSNRLSMRSKSSHLPMHFPDDENRRSPMQQDYNLDLTGIEVLPMFQSTDESPTDFYRYLDPLFAWD